MTFLNVLLLFGALAASVPLIIHLLHRSKVRVVHWAAMQFLAGVIERRSRRLQWQQWLLLAIRCAIPALLALAMAQPALTWIQNKLGSNSSSRMLVLVDNSLSMLANTPFVDAAESPRSSNQELDVSALAATIRNKIANPQIISFHNEAIDQDIHAQAFNTSIESAVAAQFAQPTTDLIDRLTIVAEKLNNDRSSLTDSATRPTLVVATDFRQSLVDQPLEDKKRKLRSLLASSPNMPQLILLPTIPLTDSPQKLDNLAVYIESSSDRLIGPDQSAKLQFKIGNFGNQKVDDVVADVQLNGTIQSTFRFTLNPGQIEQRTLLVPPLPTGEHACEIRLDRTDDFAWDNRAAWIIESIAPRPVLIVTGNTEQSSGDYLSFAITPPELNAVDGSSATVLPRQLRAIGPIRQNDQGNIAKGLELKPKHVVLANVNRLNDDLFQKVLETTTDGSIMLLAGKDLDAKWFNQFQQKFEEDLLFKVNEKLPEEGSRQLVFVPHGRTRFTNELIASLRNLDSTFTLKRFHSLTATKIGAENAEITKTANSENNLVADKQAAPGDVLPEILATSSGDPAPVIMAYEANSRRWLVSGCDFHPDDTNFPVKEAFLPFVQTFYQSQVAQQHTVRNLLVGDTLPALETSESQSNGTVVRWQRGLDPSLLSKDSTDDSSNLLIADTPGIYRAFAGTIGAEKQFYYVASQVPWSESDLTLVDRKTAKQLASELGGSIYEPESDASSVNDIATTADSTSARWNVWRWVLFTLLIALFAELLLQRYMTRSLS